MRDSLNAAVLPAFDAVQDGLSTNVEARQKAHVARSGNGVGPAAQLQLDKAIGRLARAHALELAALRDIERAGGVSA